MKHSFIMKKSFLLSAAVRPTALAVMAAALVFIGCNDPNTDIVSTPGQLTLTGLSAYNSQYVIAIGNSNPDLWAVGSTTNFTTGNTAQISGGTASLTIYDRSVSSVYSGNGSETFAVLILNSATVSINPLPTPVEIGSVTLTLSNGSGTAAVGALIIPPSPTSDTLTLTDLNDYNGNYVIAATASGTPLLALSSITATSVTGAQVSSNTATLSVYDMTYGFPIGYTASGNVTFTVLIFDTATPPTSLTPVAYGSATVPFANGNGGTVTVTGITAYP